MSGEVNKETEGGKTSRNKRLKSALGHVGLLAALMVYAAAGGLVFRELEQPAEEARLRALASTVREERAWLLQRLHNLTAGAGADQRVEAALQRYEAALADAVGGGVSVPPPPPGEPPVSRWNLLQAVFFASTVLTTIGYGNIVPVTFWGRVFCILFGLVGIPLTLTVIADMGKLFATAVQLLLARIRDGLPAPLQEVLSSWNSAGSGAGGGLQMAGRRSLTALAAVAFLLLYLAAGAGIFTLWEDEWGFHEGFYFCFITMTTIGFGDLVPRKPKYMLLCTLYILVGLALTSTIIELVRRQYAQSWRQLQALSGPLADALRRIGDRGTGAIDVNALSRMLTVISVPKGFKGGEKGAKERAEWEQAMAVVLRDLSRPQHQPPVIVIYESTV
ncbi:TWiK family of potassium channels protein 7 [Schistocerca gregaria]|uniref:TWiK family of potassium channels protein 7 n=1 Tax=Schistocerca gregaria TaxID=7010 RepID=UPI00211E1DB4|nr:TWiK family of potassium channels protein 7 [Schistocerca gregaria]